MLPSFEDPVLVLGRVGRGGERDGRGIEDVAAGWGRSLLTREESTTAFST